MGGARVGNSTRIIAAGSVACLILAAAAGWAVVAHDGAVAPNGAEQRWVAIDGDDADAGAEGAPWATLLLLMS